jgi:hypothetical protein
MVSLFLFFKIFSKILINLKQKYMQTDRRKSTDRRKTPTKPFSRYIIKGRRGKARRVEEDKNYYVDRYEPHHFVLILLIMILCVLDAYFTLKILHIGGTELNPLMIGFIDRAPFACLLFKYLITAACLVVILIHKNFIVFSKVRASFFIYIIFFLYFSLVLYEAIFFFSHSP